MKTLYSLLLAACLLLGPGGPLRAQDRGGAPLPPPPGAPTQAARIELDLDPSTSEAHVQALPADSSVVLLLGRPGRPGGRETLFAFQQYDRDLRLRTERPVDVPDEFNFVRLCAEPRIVYALFGSTRVPGRFLVAAYDAQGGQALTQVFETKTAREVVDLKAMDGHLFATVTLNDGQHLTALLLDVATGRLQFLASVYEQLPTQLSFVADAAVGRAEYVLTQTNGRKSRLQLKQLTDRGQLVSSEYVQAQSDRSLITAQLSPPQDTSTRLLTGTYSLRDPGYAQGLFATDLSAAAVGQSSLRFYDFRRLKHFFDYLNPAHLARLERRNERIDANAAEPQRWRYRLLLHELLPQADGGYVLVAEVYAPHYRSSAYAGSRYYGSGYGGYGRSLPGYAGLPLDLPLGMNSAYGNPRDADGYQTSHVVVCGFDRAGALLWDNTYVLNDVHRRDLEETVRLQSLPDGRLALAYLREDQLHYKLVDRDATGPNDLAVPLFTPPAGSPDKVLDSEPDELLPWFGTRFVASGYQRVRRPGAPDRDVFFLNAVAF
ncbi:hypothetical protein [Hymenobacter sp. PAMC 26628]|uniref:hypothetical protein n=1 Tax=Hymenobacter sp. PAMC 26628 TaxID=1484118 RepID=UPI00077002FA|nr:hypothetical protein [Hymenobacter sp. PAMC 26628]AMJ66881.1 hypothetical protein AXW84_16665 [Hymenobacter sp. PAMC 26628]